MVCHDDLRIRACLQSEEGCSGEVALISLVPAAVGHPPEGVPRRAGIACLQLRSRLQAALPVQGPCSSIRQSQTPAVALSEALTR